MDNLAKQQKKKKPDRRQVTITIGGKRHYFRGKTKTEAEEKRNAYVAQFKKTAKGSNMRLKDWIDIWYEIIAPIVTKATKESYEHIINKHITPNFGDTRLEDISHIEVRDYMNKLLKDGKSVRTVNYFLERFKAILAQAVSDEILPKNPLKVLKKAKAKEKKTKAIISIDQLHVLLQYIPSRQVQRLVLLDYATGLSRSEILGLRWADINFSNSTISVEQTIIKYHAKAQISSLTKRPSRRRTIYIDSDTAFLLKEQEKYQQSLRSCYANFIDRDLVFADRNGSPIRPDTITREISKYGKNAGMPKGFTLNSLRHTHATTLLQSGINIKIIQERLGHSSIVTTMQTYAHVTPQDEQSAATKIQEIMKDKAKKK